MDVTDTLYNSEGAAFVVEWHHDSEYQTRGSYSYDTPEETEAAEAWELERLESGALVALGFTVRDASGECRDSLWGIVVEPTAEALAEYVRESVEWGALED